jgi:mitochondrial intermediate peptidase
VLLLFQVETLFHEVGHGLNSVLCDNRLQHMFGARGPLDVVELPSHIMERVSKDRAVIADVLRDGRSEEEVSLQCDALLVRARFCHNIKVLDGLVMSRLDRELHGPNPPSTPEDLRRRVQSVSEELLGYPVSANTYANLSINHLLTYPGLYHAYAYAGTIAELVWQHHLKQDVWNAGAGRVLVEKLFRPGGTLNAEQALGGLVPGALIPVAGGFCPGSIECQTIQVPAAAW